MNHLPFTDYARCWLFFTWISRRNIHFQVFRLSDCQADRHVYARSYLLRLSLMVSDNFFSAFPFSTMFDVCVFFFAFFLQMPPSEHVIVPRLFNGTLHTERHRHTPHLKTLIYTHIFFMVNPARMWYAYQFFIWLSLSSAGFMYLANIFTF